MHMHSGRICICIRFVYQWIYVTVNACSWQCRSCDHENFGENIFWCVATLTWMAIMACCAPTTKHLSKLSFTQETSTGGPQNVGRVFGRVAVADDTNFMVDPQDSAPENFIRAGVQPDLVAQGKVASKAEE